MLPFHFILLIGQKLSDGKGVQGVGRLTQARIDSFQVFYGRAIRSNKGNPIAMSGATKAILNHYSELPPPTQHQFCPPGKDSWCKYQADISRDDGKTTFQNIKHPISKPLYDLLVPTFTALSDIHLLRACANCKDQNVNESLHHVIWGMVPKEQYHSSVEVSFGINLAVMLFNEGYVSTMSTLLNAAEVSITGTSISAWAALDKTRVVDSERHNIKENKEKRKRNKNSKLKQLDAFKRIEGSTYESGTFHSSKKDSTQPIMTGKKRALPKCSVCKQPKKGHPRGRCPNTPLSTPVETPSTSANIEDAANS